MIFLFRGQIFTIKSDSKGLSIRFLTYKCGLSEAKHPKKKALKYLFISVRIY